MKIVASARTEVGTGASRRLRASGRTPGIVYGGNTGPVNITLDHNELFYDLKKEEFHSSILDLEIDGKVEKVLLRDFQPHAYKPLVLHVDFQRVDPNQVISVKVPLHFINEEASPAAKAGGLHRVVSELEISCLPADLPAFIEVDLAGITVGQSVHLKDLKLPAGVKAVSHDTSLPIVTTEEIASSSEEETAGDAPAAESASTEA